MSELVTMNAIKCFECYFVKSQMNIEFEKRKQISNLRMKNIKCL